MKLWGFFLLLLSLSLPSYSVEEKSKLCQEQALEFSFRGFEEANEELIHEIEKRLKNFPCLQLIKPGVVNFDSYLEILEILGTKIYDLNEMKSRFDEMKTPRLADQVANQIFLDHFGVNPHFESDIFYTIINGKNQELRRQKLWQGREQSELLYSSLGAIISLSTSPDGNYLLFQDRTNVNQGQHLNIFDILNNRFGKIQFENGLVHSRASFHPNCNSLSFSYRGINDHSEKEQGIYQLDFLANRQSPSMIFDGVGTDSEPEYSPEGKLYFISDQFRSKRWFPHVKWIEAYSREANDLFGNTYYGQKAPRISVDGKTLAVIQPTYYFEEGKSVKLQSLALFKIEDSKMLEASKQTLKVFKDSQDLQWLDSSNISFLKSNDFLNSYAIFNLDTEKHFVWESIGIINKVARNLVINPGAECPLDDYFE